MRIMRLAATILLAFVTLLCQASDITPAPLLVESSEGVFVMPNYPSVNIKANGEDLLRLQSAFRQHFPNTTIAKNRVDVQLLQVPEMTEVTSHEGYILDVTPSGVEIKALSATGLFYGLQTLFQLYDASEGGKLPLVKITDEPQFPYRGVMLDISRHFRDADFIKKQIDVLASLKINRLHLHLADSAGWRIEIEKYPRLTEYAAWRPQETWAEWEAGGQTYTEKGKTPAYGGYLTKDDVRDLVAYAADRYITIIPEIEMPSHSAEVTAAYPELSCTHRPFKEHDLCIGNEATFQFLEGVLEEVLELFPSEYIHIGGDEAGKGNWKECTLCQQRMAEEGLENVDELQSYLVRRMERWLNERGRRLIGFDEILEGGLSPDATVMSWRGTEGAIEAAAQGHDAIMNHGAYLYLDSYQDAPNTQPHAFGGYLPLEKVYSFNPLPDTLTEEQKSHIIGVQGNLWAECIPIPAHSEYMLYPRVFAVAELAWSEPTTRNWPDFRQRAITLSDRLRAKGYNTFDLRNEVGNRPEAKTIEQHLAFEKPVVYNEPFWKNYPAAGDATLTDGIRGGWNYNDYRWQGFFRDDDRRLDVTIDLGEVQPVSYIGAQFMQLVIPDVWIPEKVEISVSDDGEHFTLLKEESWQQEANDALSFVTFAWEGKARTRYVRYKALSSRGVIFTDEIVVR